jgi:hypothetical protein
MPLDTSNIKVIEVKEARINLLSSISKFDYSEVAIEELKEKQDYFEVCMSDKPREETKLNPENCENCVAHNLKEKPDYFKDYFPVLQYQELATANLHGSLNLCKSHT